MRLIRFESEGSVYTGAIEGDDLSAANVVAGDAFDPRQVTGDVRRVDRLLPPVVPVDLLCIGLNYRRHAEETGSDVPPHPMLFIKASNALAAHGEDVPLPGNSDKVDWEAELAVVIGRDAKDVSAADALGHVLGYTCANDVSARDWQKDKTLGGGQFARGKSFDRFCPLGPVLVTAEEVPDPNALRIGCTVNGEVMQDSTTADMIYPVAEVIASLSRTMTVRAGSVILTGTPEGVGAARKPPRFLTSGDEVSVTIEGLGTLTNRFV